MTRRPRFFAGQLLSTDDLNQLVDHHDHQLRRHHLLLHGSGVVRGFGVRPGSGASPQIVVSAGVAIDPLGRLLNIDADTVVPLSSATATGTVVVGATERLVDPVTTSDGGTDYRSIETVVHVRVVRKVPPDHLAIGRLRRGVVVAR